MSAKDLQLRASQQQTFYSDDEKENTAERESVWGGFGGLDGQDKVTSRGRLAAVEELINEEWVGDSSPLDTREYDDTVFLPAAENLLNILTENRAPRRNVNASDTNILTCIEKNV